MSAERAERAALALFEAHAGGANAAAFAPDAAPRDLDDAYATQEALLGLREVRLGAAVGGWKIALTTPVMQRFVGIDHPCAGGILAPRIHRSPAVVREADFVHLNVEAEIAVRIAAPPPRSAAPLDRDAVASSVAAAMAAIELVDDRNCTYDPLDVLLLVADNAFNAGCVLGPERTDWRALDLQAVAGQMVVNDAVEAEGTGADMLGHPLDALAWVANHLRDRGRELAAGDIVMLGSIAPPRWLAAGDRMTTRMEGLGAATVEVR